MTNTAPAPTRPATSTSEAITDLDPRAAFASAAAVASATIAAVSPAQLVAATPCAELDVRHLLGHLVDVLRRVAVIGRGEPIFSIAPLDATTVPDDGWLALWQAGLPAVTAAWADDATLTPEVVLPWSTASGADTLVGYAGETIVHTWDLARATGQRPVWDDTVVAAALVVDERRIPGGDRLAAFERIIASMPEERRPLRPAFLDVVAVADDAPLIDRLVAWTGRDPGWSRA